MFDGGTMYYDSVCFAETADGTITCGCDASGMNQPHSSKEEFQADIAAIIQTIRSANLVFGPNRTPVLTAAKSPVMREVSK